VGKCVVRDLPETLPAQTPIDVRFRYLENGRLTITVNVEGTNKELKHEISRENSLSSEQIESWRQYIHAISGGGTPVATDGGLASGDSKVLGEAPSPSESSSSGLKHGDSGRQRWA
jgi:hypothetical protein